MDNLNLKTFLISVGLGHLVQHMLEEELTLDILLQASDAELSELTTKLADKIKLRTSLEKIRLHNDSNGLFSPRTSTCSPVSVALPERQSILILGPGGTLEGTPFDDAPVQATPAQHSPVQATTSPHSPVQNTAVQLLPVQTTLVLPRCVGATCVQSASQENREESLAQDFSFTLEECALNIFKDIDTYSGSSEEVGQSPSALYNLLCQHTRGKLLIEKSKKGQPLISRDRSYIVSLIVEAELQLLQKLNQTIRKDVWQKWSEEIAALFKGELKSLYYVPYHIVEGKIIQASGLIHNRLITHRRSLTLESTSKKRKADSDSGCSSDSSKATNKRLRPLPDKFEDKSTSDSEESLDWLRGSSSPPEILIAKWQATFDLRAKILKDVSYVEYFNTFPGLKLPDGHKLLTADFEAVYPSANITYVERFPLVKLKLLKLLAERGESSKSDQTTFELLQLASTGEEQASLAALLGIVALLRQMHTVTVPKKKLWRLTREETRSGFLARVAAASDIATYCAQREAFNVSKGIPNQPYILAVGPTWENISTFEIVTTAGGLRYQVPTICEAIKVTYNLYWALDCAYPKVAAPCWMVIQRAMFQMQSKFDVEGVPLRELLSELSVVN